MLDTIRKRKDNLIFSGLILVTAVVMGFFGISNMSNDQSSGGVAAWVNGEAISHREFQDELEDRMGRYRQMLGDTQDEKFLQALQIPQRTLDEMVKFKLVAQQAKKLGVDVTDRELADHIRSLPYFQKDGKFDPELYKRVRNPGIEEERQRERLELLRYQTFLVERVKVSPSVAERVTELENAKAEIEFAKIDFAAIADRTPAPAGTLAKFQETVGDEALRQHFEKTRTKYTKKARYRFRQIRAGLPFQASEAQRNEARQKIAAIAKEATPAAFAEVAKKRSDDEHAKEGGLIDWVEKGALDPALEQALAKLSKDGVSQPVETSFGIYLLQLLDKEPESAQPFETVRPLVAASLFQENNRKETATRLRAEWDRRLAAGQPLEPELKKNSIELKSTGLFALGQGFIPQLGAADGVLDEVFQLQTSKPAAKRLVPLEDQFVYVRLKKFERTLPKKPAAGTDEAAQAVGGLQAEIFEKWLEHLRTNSSVKVAGSLQSKSEDPGMGG